jgi:hypothetical protein
VRESIFSSENNCILDQEVRGAWRRGRNYKSRHPTGLQGIDANIRVSASFWNIYQITYGFPTKVPVYA